MVEPVYIHEQQSVIERPLVLAADDDEDNLLILIHALNLFGFAHISTTKGQSVLQLAQTYQPDLILLDIVLPDLGGIDIIQHLKQTPQTKSIPIIAVTALARSEERQELLRMGCSDCLYKPYSLNALEALLQQHLTQHHLTQMRSAS